MILDESLFENVKSSQKFQKRKLNLDEALDVAPLDLSAPYEIEAISVEIPEEITESDNAMSSILNNLIKEELDAVQLYNDAIIQCSGNGFTQFIDVFKSLASEETAHVGELQRLLDEINPTTTKEIFDGQQEAETILNKEEDEDPEEGQHY